MKVERVIMSAERSNYSSPERRSIMLGATIWPTGNLVEH